MNRKQYHPIIPERINKNYQSFEELLVSIKQIADNMFYDTSSTSINESRVESLRILLSLFLEYNERIEALKAEKIKDIK